MTAEGDGPHAIYVPPAESTHYEEAGARLAGDESTPWLRRTWPIIRARRVMFGTSLALSLAGLIIQVQIPNVIRLAIDNSLVTQDRAIGPYIWIIVVLAAARWLVMYIGRLNLLRTAFRFEYDLRNMLYRHLARLSFSFYDRTESGLIISRANSDIRAVQRYLAFGPNILVQCSVAPIAFVQMLLINVPLACIAMLAMPVVFFTGLRMRMRVMPASWLGQVRMAELSGVIAENISGVRVVKSYAAEQQQLHSFDETAKRARWASIREAEIRARYSPIVENVARLGSVPILILGGWMVIHDQATIGTIVAFNAYILLVQPPLRQLGLFLMMGRRAATAAGRICELMDAQPEVVDAPAAIDLVNARGEIKFDHVRFAYGGGSNVLTDFSMHLDPGETVAIVGRTGSGKSTIAKLLARFYDVDAGSVCLDGVDVRDLSMASVRHTIGLVQDEAFLFSASIRDNIAYARPDADVDEIVAAARIAQADDFVRRLPAGYDTVVGERGYDLSGGQRQRLAIARALVARSPVLVFDDATSAIDVVVEERIHGGMRTLIGNQSMIIIAHRLSSIMLADRVVVLADGRVAASGTHQQLLADSALYRGILVEQAHEDAARGSDDMEGSDGW